MKTAEMCVSTGSAPERRRSSAAASACPGGIMGPRPHGNLCPRASGATSRVERLHAPAFAVPVEDLPVMQAEGHVAPELDSPRQDAEAGPVLGAGDLAD